MSRTLRGLLLFALLVSVLAACGAQQPLGPKDTADAYLRAMAAQDYAAAYKLLSPDSQASVTVEDYQKMLTAAWKDAKVTEIQVKSVQDEVLARNGNRASVPYSIAMKTEDGATTDVYNALSLVLVNGQWGVIWPPVR
jgi:uncharacterized lipoprotein